MEWVNIFFPGFPPACDSVDPRLEPYQAPLGSRYRFHRIAHLIPHAKKETFREIDLLNEVRHLDAHAAELPLPFDVAPRTLLELGKPFVVALSLPVGAVDLVDLENDLVSTLFDFLVGKVVFTHDDEVLDVYLSPLERIS